MTVTRAMSGLTRTRRVWPIRCRNVGWPLTSDCLQMSPQPFPNLSPSLSVTYRPPLVPSLSHMIEGLILIAWFQTIYIFSFWLIQMVTYIWMTNWSMWLISRLLILNNLTWLLYHVVITSFRVQIIFLSFIYIWYILLSTPNKVILFWIY